MSKINLFGRMGNKQHDIKHFKHLLPRDVKNVVEPFGGSFAVIRKEYNDDTINKFVNDNDDDLYKIYTNPDEYYETKVKINKILGNNLVVSGKTGREVVKHSDALSEINSLDCDDSFRRSNLKEIACRGNIIKYTKSTNCQEHINIIKKIIFSNEDWEDYTKIHSKNVDTFIFLDPPYLFSDNTQYSKMRRKEDADMTDMIPKIADIFKNPETKAKIMLVINDMKIIRYFFNDFIKTEYSKIYAISKRKDNHLVICNF
jgi:site-specific DNA-adenine methylase